MATIAAQEIGRGPRPDRLSGTPRAHAIDRWIFVAMAAWFIVIVLVGFIPDAIGKVAAVKAGTHPPFPPILHVHAVLMASFLLLQLHAGILFAIFITMALWARRSNSGFHKRMIFLATAVPLGASIDRMWWLPNTFPGSPMGTDGYIFLALAPLFVWDVVRNRRVHEAYIVWAAIFVPVSLLMERLWDTPAWHATARHLMGV